MLNEWILQGFYQYTNSNNLNGLGFVLDILRCSTYSFEEKEEILKLSNSLCSMIDMIFNDINIQNTTKKKAIKTFFLIWETSDIMLNNFELYELNSEEVAKTLNRICTFDYRNNVWADKDSNDKFSQFYLAVYKSLWVISLLDNKIAKDTVEICKTHFDERIAEQALEG